VHLARGADAGAGDHQAAKCFDLAEADHAVLPVGVFIGWCGPLLADPKASLALFRRVADGEVAALLRLFYTAVYHQPAARPVRGRVKPDFSAKNVPGIGV